MFDVVAFSMQLVVGMLLLMWLIMEGVVNSESLPGITDGKFMEDCVKAHNRARSSVEPPASDMMQMTWDEGLAVSARAWAKKCPLRQSMSIAGQNIWVEKYSGFTVEGAIASWVEEKTDYGYKSNTCSNICDHYKQVVWASSRKVGCAVEQCITCPLTKRKRAIFVCYYDPVGKLSGTRPYKTGGKPCTACEGVCVERLCRDAQTQGLDAALSGCGFPCVAVVGLRPLLLICSFLTAYAVQRLYPDIYCYK